MADTYPKNTIDDNGLKKVWDMVMDRLGLKVDKEAGKGLSTNDYTTTEKNKLAGIASGAEVNTVTSVAGKTGAVTLDKSDVGLENVGNFKAVSTSANQGLTNTEKSNARDNIDTPSNGDVQSSKTVSGNVVTVNDAAPINAEDITVDITPVQDLHGLPFPYAGGAYKNKYQMRDTSASNRGVEVVANSDGTLQLSGTATGGSVQISLIGNWSEMRDLIAAGGTYVMSYSEGTYSNRTLNATITYKETEQGSVKYIVPNDPVIIPQGSIYYGSMLWVPEGATVQTLTHFAIQLEAGSTPTSFADYENICPIEGRTGAELDRVGKNWVKPFNYQSISDDGVTYANADEGYKMLEDSILPAGTYTISIKLLSKPSTSRTIHCFKAGDTSDTKASFVGLNNLNLNQVYSNTFTLSEPTELTTRLWGTGGGAFKVQLQIELGTQPTTYEPYQGQQYTASFGELVYGGKWHVTKGGTDKTMKLVDFGDLTWETASTIQQGKIRFRAWFNEIKQVPDTVVANILSTIYGPENANAVYNCIQGIATSATAISVYDKTKQNMTAAEFKTAMTGQKILYELATPTTISTPKQNVPMLQGINTVSADCGDTQLKYQPDNVIGELKGEIQKANSFVERMALREGSGAKDFSYGGWSFRLYIYRSMGQISMSLERISASSVTEQVVDKVFNGESDYRAPEELRPNFNLLQAATYTTPSGWAIQVYLEDDGYIMFTGMAPAVGASAPISSNWNLVEPWATHQQAKDLFNN